MARKDNIKAAQNYEDSLIYASVSEQCDVQKAFITGANWRIESVWHNDLKKGKTKKPILVRFKNGLFNLFEDIRELKGIEDKVEIFAYLEDLTPNLEEYV